MNAVKPLHRDQAESLTVWRERLVVQAFTAVLFAGIFLVLLLPLFSRQSWMIFVQDDFLYYLKVAQNIVHGKGSTFNGIAPTNGYQPLWLAILVGLSFVTENTRFILGFLAAVNFVSAAVTFYLASKILRRANVRPLLIFIFAACVTLYSVTLFFYGMEVTLTVPIILGVILLLRDIAWIQQSAKNALLLGLLLSAMVLSRIDTLILGGVIFVGMLVYAPARRLIRPDRMLAVGAGLLPLLGYFLSNHVIFYTWLPISGMAKQLKTSRLPSLEPWLLFLHPLAGGFTLILIAGFALLPGIAARLNPMERIVLPAVLAFPFLYYSVLSLVSDWTLWGWYMYPIRTALCVSLLIFCLTPPIARMLQHRIVLVFLVLAVFGYLSLLRWTKQQVDIFAASVEIKDFAATHPGIYAMGDRAGRVAYLIPDPVLQTEGLMMDLNYLSYLKAQMPLRTVLNHYGVQYYVATAYEPYSGCFEAREPAKAGVNSAHMHAEFCEAPLATYTHDGIQTLIFDVGHSTNGTR